METSFSNIKGMYRANTDIINKAIADMKDEDWFRQPGNDSNHLMWLLGHVVVHRGHVLKMLGGDWNTSWAPLFARGAERVDSFAVSVHRRDARCMGPGNGAIKKHAQRILCRGTRKSVSRRSAVV